MKRKLADNVSWKLLSLFLAFILWLVIMNLSDPTISRKFTNIPVAILNENAITSIGQNGKVYEVLSGDKVDVIVKGKRSVVEKLEEKQFKATADFSKLSAVNAVAINVTLNSSKRSDVELDWGNAVMKISLEEKAEKEYQVQVKTAGKLSAEYVLGDVKVQPNVITVEGGKSKIKRIASVGVVVSLNNETVEVDQRLKPILYDSDGNVIDSSNITFKGSKTVRVLTTILPTKSIPVKVNVTGKPAKGYRLDNTTYKPDNIVLSGRQSELDKISEITLDVDVAGAKADVERDIDITNQLGANVKIVGSNTNKVSVRCVIAKNGKRTFILSNSDIKVMNLPKNLSVSFSDSSAQYQVDVFAAESELKDFTVALLGAYIDASNLNIGTHSVPLYFKTLNQYEVKCSSKVKVRLQSANDDNPPTASPTDDDSNNG